jgi:hypothetical protein
MNFIAFLNGFRKLTICMVVITLSSAFTISGHISGDHLTTILTITIPAYFAGNVGEHVTESIKEFLNTKTGKNGKES